MSYNDIPTIQWPLSYSVLLLSGVYDDPWNVDQVQQEILDQLEQKQKQRTTSGGSIKGRPSNTDTAQSNRMHKR